MLVFKVSFKYELLEIINSRDKDLKKISVDKTTLEIVLLFYKYELEKKDIIADIFLEENKIESSRSKKITIIQNLEKNNIIERKTNIKDKRTKMISLKKEVKDKLKKYLEN